MSSGRGKRAELMEGLGRELRNFSDQDVLFSQALADRLGINLTDFKCLSILERTGAVTAGQLAELTGLTSGAVTGLIDRLEKAGFARRVRDPKDRRHVIIEAVPERGSDFEALLGASGRAMAELCAGYSEEQLGLLLDFLTRGATLLHGETASLRAEKGARAADAPGEFSAPLGSLESARLRFTSGVSHLTLRADAGMAQLYVARFEGRSPTVREEGGSVQIQYPRFSLLDWRKLKADVALNGSIPWQIELKGGVSKLNADLSALRLESIELTGGASDGVVTLPRPSGVVPIRVVGGASQLTLALPTGVAARLQVKGGVSKLAFLAQRLGAVGGQMSLETPDYKSAADRFDIEISGGASNLTVEDR
ncbi:MarR family winged helix-turn-helix transcriptional regulator [Hyalangium rubrum]|uniref:MarR family transcriptional regulator n=1 Tax=Hyalangium rubrum TaxID=3103134 RepID=A0ABU5H661_9BACT|nr:MarR family transcriptional regulator [Hyalangium sp. s54d21]MDY7228966.1 MarR family transcriptional regulator [Hyalangium sp. s54d21]